MRKNKKGFTLVEILAVILLISLIVIIAVPSVKNISYKSKKKLLITKIKLTEEAVNLWGINNKSCFTEVGGCNVLEDCTVGDVIICKTTFGKLAANGIINYDEKTKDNYEYVVNPVNSKSLNDEELTVTLENNVVKTDCSIDEENGKEIDRDEDVDADQEGNIPSEGENNQGNAAVLIVDANGGNYLGNVIIQTTKGGTVKLTPPEKEGYEFDEWIIVEDSGSGSVNGDEITINSLSLKVQAQYKANIPEPVNFATDSWTTIAANVQANKEATATVYSVGSEKEVAIGGTNYTVRIANNSNYDCSLESKTACGFVVEFVDIVEKRAMNSSATNVGGWPATEMRTYLNGEFLAKLPSDLQSVIADTTTTVVSGHGSDDSSNFTSTDKIYLLSTKEIWVDGSSNIVSNYDTAYNTTRQLDYYANNNVTTTTNYSGAIKNYAGSAAWWWLRAAGSNGDSYFFVVSLNGYWSYANSASGGLAPAFRIA